MALHNLAKVYTTTVGTGTITLGSVFPGFLSFSGAGAIEGETVSYGILDGYNSEVGRGAFSASGSTLARTTILNSTNTGSRIALSGSAIVFITALAQDFSGSGPFVLTAGDSMSGSLTVSGSILISGSLNKLVGNTQNFVDIDRDGFLNQTETSLSFDGVNTFTLVDSGSGWSYYRSGIKYTISGNKTVTLTDTPPAAMGTYHISIDATDGTLSSSLTDWTLNDTKVSVAQVMWNNALTPKYQLAEERHSALIDRRMHYYLHTTRGTQLNGGTTISGLSANTDTRVAKRVSMSQASIEDEDIIETLPPLVPAGSPFTSLDYTILYRTSASAWSWYSSDMPFAYNSGTNAIQYDSGSSLIDGSGGPGSNAKYYNSYILYTNLSGSARFAIASGRNSFASLALAQAEDPLSFSWTGIDIDEMLIGYQLTWGWDSNSYTSPGKVVFKASKAINTGALIISQNAGTINHNALLGLQGGISPMEYYHTSASQNTLLNTSGSNSFIPSYSNNDQEFLNGSGSWVNISTAGSFLSTSSGSLYILRSGDNMYGQLSSTVLPGIAPFSVISSTQVDTLEVARAGNARALNSLPTGGTGPYWLTSQAILSGTGIQGTLQANATSVGKAQIQILANDGSGAQGSITIASDKSYTSGSFGINTSVPQVKLDVSGGIRAMDSDIPVSGCGLELGYSTGSNAAYLYSFDRTTPQFKSLILGGSSISFRTMSGSSGSSFTTPIIIDKGGINVIGGSYLLNGTPLISGSVNLWSRDTINGTINPVTITDKVGIGSSSASATLDVNGMVRIYGSPPIPSSGCGIELYAFSGSGFLTSIDRTSPFAFKQMFIQGSVVGFNIAANDTGALYYPILRASLNAVSVQAPAIFTIDSGSSPNYPLSGSNLSIIYNDIGSVQLDSGSSGVAIVQSIAYNGASPTDFHDMRFRASNFRFDNGVSNNNPLFINSLGLVGVNNAVPTTILDVVGMIRTGPATLVTPSSGCGLELYFIGNSGYITSYNRSPGGYFLPMQIYSAGTSYYSASATGTTASLVAFYGATGLGVLGNMSASNYNGWNPPNETWYYVSASKVQIYGDVSTKYQTGDQIKLTNSGVKYFYMVNTAFAGSATTITLNGGSDYALTVGTITNMFFSKSENPQGFPDWFNWTSGSIMGFSSLPANNATRFKIDGRACYIQIRQSANGVSNGSSLIFYLPNNAGAASTYSSWNAMCSVVNNNIAGSIPGMAKILPSGSFVQIYRDAASLSWTTTGSKRVEALEMWYEL